MRPETRQSLKAEGGKAYVYIENAKIKIQLAHDPEVKLIYQKLKEAKEERYEKIIRMLKENTVCV